MDTVPKIFLVLAGRTLEENRLTIDRYRPHIDGLELRVDHLEDPERQDWKGFFRTAGLPAILTIRKPEDGGRYRGGETERNRLFLRLLSEGEFSYVDLEEASDLPEVENEARRRGSTVVRSFHDFSGVPEGLADRIRKLPRGRDEIPQAAVPPKSSRDLRVLIETFRSLEGTKKILIGMGEFGFPTRALAPKLGSYLGFASPDGGRIAPGLVDPGTLDRVYRFHAQDRSTRINGIIGNPILHSRSPEIHNKAYDRLGLDAVYVPFHVDDVEEFLETAKILGMGGFSVTVPFKETILPLCTWTEDAVRAIGACNTAVLGPGAEEVKGYNTDAEGFLVPLERIFERKGASEGRRLEGLNAAVIGAGGAARSVVYALAKEGASVLVINRTAERAERLVRDMQAALGLAEGRLRAAASDEAGIAEMRAYGDLVVQTTSVGMHPREEEDALPSYRFTGREVVYDIVYAPRETVFLKRAAGAGCRIVHGDEMLMNQAYRQFFLYTGESYPRDEAGT